MKLNTCHADLQRLAHKVLEVHDCTVLTGFRGEHGQTTAFKTGRSKTEYPNSKHNRKPSEAIDLVPYPIDWEDEKRFYYFAGIVMAIAHSLNIKIRWGGDWDRDNNFKDQTFNDLVHFELQ